MALDRFSNISEIQETDGKVRGVVYTTADARLLQLDVISVTPEDRPVVELQLYTIGQSNNYVTGGIINAFRLENDKLLINYAAACRSLGIERGQFEVVINIHKNLLGSYNNPLLYVKEVSDDRREVLIKGVPNSDLNLNAYLGAFGQGNYLDPIYSYDQNGEIELDETGQPLINDFIERPLSDDIYLNFGDNRLSKIINQKDWAGRDEFVVRLYQPLPVGIDLSDPLWVVEQLSDSYVDNISLTGTGALADDDSRQLRGPNFDIDTTGGTVTETDFANWNQLLDANLSTSQQIVDRVFSGSIGSDLNLDYSGFQNFVHFSSAAERLQNFKYKLELIEYYDTRLTILANASGSDSGSLQGNVQLNRQRRNNVIGSFDGFERWLYNEPTQSIFTDHAVYSNNNNRDGVYRADGGFIGAQEYRLEPWPKFLSGSRYYLHHTTSSIATTWYQGFSSTASLYDTENKDRLVNTIPEHIRLDENNDQYELFVNMIGHHFDILYTYIDNLTRVYKPEEHPKLGQNKDTLYQIAKSLGWSLQNGNQATALWKYKLGVNSGTGAFQTTGSLFSKANEEITTEVWRRIVNNLPFLLKTKGTARSIKALMNTYGIPQTLLSIREYGGPKVNEDAPLLIEDRFSYALNYNVSNAYLKSNASHVSSSIIGFGIDRGVIAPQQRQFRFRPSEKRNMLLYSVGTDSTPSAHIALQYTSSYSGSDEYGRIVLVQSRFSGGTTPTSSVTDWLPLYDGNFWNVAYDYRTDGVHYNTGSNTDTTYTVHVQHASDYIINKVLHSATASITPTFGDHYLGWSNSSPGAIYSYLGGRSGSSDTLGVNAELSAITTSVPAGFSGSMQEYREWLEPFNQTTFDLHTTNPSSYVSGLSPTSSFDTLIRHYPLGTDLNAVDISGVDKYVTSSHPANTIKDFTQPDGLGLDTYATASNFPTPNNAERGNFVPVEETYYVQGVSLGTSLPRSEKIRFDTNTLVGRLSPVTTAERSRFDRAPLDTNRLGLFYSVADQINKDIFNHIGDVALDDYIGDPDDAEEYEYPDLLHFSKEYWKKYTDRNDLNAYIRIFSQFDFSLFNQIKQLLPERVDEVMGLLIEPHALERVKARVAKRPVVQNNTYEGILTQSLQAVTGLYEQYTGSILAGPSLVSSSQVYHVGSSGYADTGNYRAVYQMPIASGTYTGSVNQGVIRNQRISDIYRLDVLHYSGSVSASRRLRNWQREVSRSSGEGLNSSWNYSRSLADTSYRDDFFQAEENLRFEGCRIIGPGVNIASDIAAIGFRPVVEVFQANPNTLIFNPDRNVDNPGRLEVE